MDQPHPFHNQHSSTSDQTNGRGRSSSFGSVQPPNVASIHMANVNRGRSSSMGSLPRPQLPSLNPSLFSLPNQQPYAPNQNPHYEPPQSRSRSSSSSSQAPPNLQSMNPNPESPNFMNYPTPQSTPQGYPMHPTYSSSQSHPPPAPPSSHMSQEQLEKAAQRRATHTLIERRRRDRINSKIQELKLIQPKNRDREMSKVDILQGAIEYIRDLNFILDTVMSECGCGILSQLASKVPDVTEVLRNVAFLKTLEVENGELVIKKEDITAFEPAAKRRFLEEKEPIYYPKRIKTEPMEHSRPQATITHPESIFHPRTSYVPHHPSNLQHSTTAHNLIHLSSGSSSNSQSRQSRTGASPDRASNEIVQPNLEYNHREYQSYQQDSYRPDMLQVQYREDHVEDRSIAGQSHPSQAAHYNTHNPEENHQLSTYQRQPAPSQPQSSHTEPHDYRSQPMYSQSSSSDGGQTIQSSSYYHGHPTTSSLPNPSRPQHYQQPDTYRAYPSGDLNPKSSEKSVMSSSNWLPPAHKPPSPSMRHDTSSRPIRSITGTSKSTTPFIPNPTSRSFVVRDSGPFIPSFSSNTTFSSTSDSNPQSPEAVVSTMPSSTSPSRGGSIEIVETVGRSEPVCAE
ncbi:hypothetical protein BKA69DRAFT_1068565 [Paraphysoderma sedebokerense]|nr:hypothetical protein BKA69DRAFT_1068565 [Paraphysoderma sedebokerense]